MITEKGSCLLYTSVKEIADLMNTSYDKFIRTTDEYHEKQVQKIFKKLYGQGEIYKGYYEGMYCTPVSYTHLEGEQRRNGEWYLKDSRYGSGKPVTEVADGLVFVIDSEAPEVIFHSLSLEKNKIGEEERGLNFGTYQNTSYAEKVSVEDQNSLDERGSGRCV